MKVTPIRPGVKPYDLHVPYDAVIQENQHLRLAVDELVAERMWSQAITGIQSAPDKAPAPPQGIPLNRALMFMTAINVFICLGMGLYFTFFWEGL